MRVNKSLATEPVDASNDCEMDALIRHVLAEGDKIYQERRRRAIELGITDEQGRLLKTELPEDMREDAGTDFGG